MKKIISVAVSVLLSFTISTSVFASTRISPFPDVPLEHEYYDGVDYLRGLLIAQGYPDGTYQPDRIVTRGEVTKILINTAYPSVNSQICFASTQEIPLMPSLEANYNTIKDFSDVSRSDGFGGYICIAKKYNIVSGFSDGSFKTDEPIEFGAAAKILANALSLNPDLAQNTMYEKFKAYVMRLEEKKAIPNSINSLSKKVTRGELAEMIYRIKTGVQKPSRTYSEIATVVTVQDAEEDSDSNIVIQAK